MRFQKLPSSFRLAGLMAIISLVFGGGCATNPEVETATWGELNHARYGAAAVTVGNSIYVLGGCPARGHTVPVERIDLTTGRVEDLPWKLIPRRYHTAQVADGAIWVFGGEYWLDGSDTVVKSVERIDLQTGKITVVRDLQEPRSALSSVQFNNRIYLVGGSQRAESAQEESTQVESFDPTKITSRLESEFPEKIEVDIAMTGGKIYAMGGWNDTTGTSNRGYSARTDLKWVRTPELPFGLSANTTVGADNFLYSFGDYTDKGRVARYHTQTKQWSVLDVSYTPRRHACSTIVNGTVFVIGGNTQSRGSALKTIEAYPIANLRTAKPKSI